MSPHRFIKSIAGVHGGVLVIVGLWYLGLGFAWATAPSQSMAETVSWIPHGEVNQGTIGGLWLTAGAVCLIAGLWSKRHPAWEAVAYCVAVLVPVLVSGYAAAAWWFGTYPLGLVVSVVYIGPAAIIAWLAVRVKDDDHRAEVAT